MIRRLVLRLVTDRQKRALKTARARIRKAWIARFRSYGAKDLHAELERLGVRRDDTLLVHANFSTESGFRGSPADLAGAFADWMTPQGTLLMVSQPFRGYAYDYLKRGKVFDVRKTVSMMGLVTEMFRRRPDTLRSLHPTHPVLAAGADAAELLAGHDRCEFPCGPGTPFEKLRDRNAWILFFDVSSGANTFFHHVEDSIKDELGVALYADEVFDVKVVDAAGRPGRVRTYAFAPGLVRHTDWLEEELVRRGQLARGRVGNSQMSLVRAQDIAKTMTDMVNSGIRLIEPAGN